MSEATRPEPVSADRDLRAEIEELETELRETRQREAGAEGAELRAQLEALARRRDILTAHVVELTERRAALVAQLAASKAEARAQRRLRLEDWLQGVLAGGRRNLGTLIFLGLLLGMIGAGLGMSLVRNLPRSPLDMPLTLNDTNQYYSVMATARLTPNSVVLDVPKGEPDLFRDSRLIVYDARTKEVVADRTFSGPTPDIVIWDSPPRRIELRLSSELPPGRYVAVVRAFNYRWLELRTPETDIHR